MKRSGAKPTTVRGANRILSCCAKAEVGKIKTRMRHGSNARLTARDNMKTININKAIVATLPQLFLRKPEQRIILGRSPDLSRGFRAFPLLVGNSG